MSRNTLLFLVALQCAISFICFEDVTSQIHIVLFIYKDYCQAYNIRQMGLQQWTGVHLSRLYPDDKRICSKSGKLKNLRYILDAPLCLDSLFSLLKIDALKQELEAFYGNKSRESKDMSRIVNLNQFDRLSKMLEEKEVSDKIIYGGQKNRDNL